MTALSAVQHTLTAADVKGLIHDYAVWIWLAIVMMSAR